MGRPPKTSGQLETSARIMDAAEGMIREGGYFGFSFRQVADDLAIKSASVHYHFPNKEALGVAVAERYSERFLSALGEPGQPGAVQVYVGQFRRALHSDGRACLCGVLAGEAGKIPRALREVLGRFRQRNVDWLERAFASARPAWAPERCRQSAVVFFSGLEGAMTFAGLSGEIASFDEVADGLLNQTVGSA